MYWKILVEIFEICIVKKCVNLVVLRNMLRFFDLEYNMVRLYVTDFKIF